MSETVTKKVLVNKLVSAHNFAEEEAKVIVNEFFKSIVDVVSTGEELCLTGFGSFSVREKNASQGRNPTTGEEYVINERKVVNFRSSAILRDKINTKNI